MTTVTVIKRVNKGWGQLKAYINAEEGVAFQMDNKLIWDSLGRVYDLAIQGVHEKKESSKFSITLLPSQKVMLRDWTGMYLASKSSVADPTTHLLFLVPYSDDESLQFDVFYRDNEVAFQAYNGLFLARAERGFHKVQADTFHTVQADTLHPVQTDIFHTIEATKVVADNSCCFRPMIGDLTVPIFKILTVITSDLSEDTGNAHVVSTETFINRTNVPQTHTFSMTWEADVIDKIVWRHLWGLGIANSCQFTIANMTATLKYTEDNDKAILLTRKIYERRTEEVVVPPNSQSIASLTVVKSNHFEVPFMAIIHKMKSNGDVVILRESGAWRGLLYFGVYLEITSEHLTTRCTFM